MNPRLNKLMLLAIAENILNMSEDEHKEKLILIEDIFKVKKLLFGLGDNRHDEFMTDKASGELFNELYDYNLVQLNIIYSGYQIQVNQLANANIQKQTT